MFLRKLILMLVLLALPFGFVHAQTTDNATDFTYQGYLELNGSPVNDTCDFTFSLYNAPTAGTLIGTAQSLPAITVTEGVFSVQLDFGANAFDGNDRWLEIAVNDCSGGATFTPLSPRQAITPAAYAIYSTSAWNLNGNSLINPGTQFIGTTDNTTLTFRANNQRVLAIEPDATSPNILGGFSGNTIGPNTLIYGATISGGGTGSGSNHVGDNYGTVSGGYGNRAGGQDINNFNQPAATVSGGIGNKADGALSVISGGENNVAAGTYSIVAGGRTNLADSVYGVISGGGYNTVTASFGVIGGGGSDTPGFGNSVTDLWGTVGGGATNRAGDNDSDTTDVLYATVAGGSNNIASGWESTVGGGGSNIAGGLNSTIPGGGNNQAYGQYSFAAGNNALASYDNTFVWADGITTTSMGASTFTTRASGGYYLFSGSGGSGVTLAPGGNSWDVMSDRSAKANFEAVDTRAVLETVTNMPITTWNYRSQDESIRHIGPMAQDFAAFGVGSGNTTINTVDADGIALAAIQGLNLKLQDEIEVKDAQIVALQGQVNLIMLAMVIGFGVTMTVVMVFVSKR